MPSDLSLKALNRATLARQMLLAREKATPLRVIEKLVGMQAQWPQPPFIGLWSRLTKFESTDLTRLLSKRKVVRATMMRSTIHLMSTKDYLALRGPIQSALTRGMTSILRKRLDGLDIPKLVKRGRAFFDAEPRTFGAFRDELTKAHPKGDVRAMAYVVRNHLPLVQVPTDTRWGHPGNADFAVAESWLNASVGADDDPHGLVRRYLAAFGPASATDMQAWSGHGSMRDVFEALRPKLRVFRDERNRELFDLPKAPRPAARTAAPVRLLPMFDNLIIGHDDRRRFVADGHRKSVYLSGARVLPTFLVDGFVAGTWKIERTKTKAKLELSPFDKLAKKAQTALAAESERLVRFVEPDVRSHEVRFNKA